MSDFDYGITTAERWDEAEKQAVEYISGLSETEKERISKHLLRRPDLLTKEVRDEQLGISLAGFYEAWYDDLNDVVGAGKEWKRILYDNTTAEHYTNNAIKALTGTYRDEGYEILKYLGKDKFDAEDFSYLGSNTYMIGGFIVAQFHQSPAGMEWWLV